MDSKYCCFRNFEVGSKDCCFRNFEVTRNSLGSVAYWRLVSDIVDRTEKSFRRNRDIRTSSCTNADVVEVIVDQNSCCRWWCNWMLLVVVSLSRLVSFRRWMPYFSLIEVVDMIWSENYRRVFRREMWLSLCLGSKIASTLLVAKSLRLGSKIASFWRMEEGVVS